MDLKILEKCQKSPKTFIKNALGCKTLQPYHEIICDEVAEHDKVAISACHAIGKTFIFGRIVPWFLYCFPRSIIITTAPTSRQVEFLLWGEISSAVKKAPYNLGGHLTNKKLQLDKDWYALGFSPRKEAGDGDGNEQKGSTFQGWHSDYILIIFDEATGIPADIWTQVEGLLTSGKVVKFLCIGNPTTKNCAFYDCFNLPSWRKIYLSCFDSPNLPANGLHSLDDIKKELVVLNELSESARLERIKGYKKPVTYLLSAQWVMERAMEWGIDSPLFQSKVLGIFPDFEDGVYIQSETVKIAQARTNVADEKDTRYIGIDVARYGEDKSVFTEIQSSVHTRTDQTAKRDLMHVTGKAVRFIMDDDQGQKTIVLIDCTGLGSGVYDRLIELQKDKEIPRNIRFVEFHFGASVKSVQKNKKKPTKKEKQEQDTYLNVKSLMFDQLGKDLKNNLRLRKDAIYNAELPTIKYKYQSNGKMKVESKDDYKKRTNKPSPDFSDSLAMANFAKRYSEIGAFLNKMIG